MSRKRGSAQDTCLVLLAWFLEVFVAGQAILGGVEPSVAERAAISDIHLPREYVPHSVLRLAWAWICQKDQEGMQKVMESHEYHKPQWMILKAS